jgi:Integrase core domain
MRPLLPAPPHLQLASFSSACCATASSRGGGWKPKSWYCGNHATITLRFAADRESCGQNIRKRQCRSSEPGHQRRQLVWIAVTQNPTAEWLARQITEAFPWDTAPKYLIRDNDRAFGGAFKARVRAMGIRDRPTSFRSPWQNGYVERLIGSVRRECTDHLIALNAEHLRRILAKYAIYYNEVRTHVSLEQDAPCVRPIERIGNVVAHPILGGLHHRYARI